MKNGMITESVSKKNLLSHACFACSKLSGASYVRIETSNCAGHACSGVGVNDKGNYIGCFCRRVVQYFKTGTKNGIQRPSISKCVEILNFFLSKSIKEA